MEKGQTFGSKNLCFNFPGAVIARFQAEGLDERIRRFDHGYIAEGFDRGSRLEFINLLEVSKGETGELKSQLYRCVDLKYISPESFSGLYNDADELARMISGLIEYLNTSTIKGNKFKNRSNVKN